jgi:hypothetical protein
LPFRDHVGGSVAGVSTCHRPLVELLTRSECCARNISPVLVLRSHSTVRDAPVLWVSAADAAGGWFRSPGSNLSAGFGFLQSLDRPTLGAPLIAGRRLSWAFVPFGTCGSPSPLRRALPAHRFRLRGLATPLTASSSASLADLVSDRQRSWGSPFGVFSSRRVPRHRCRADPRAVSRSCVCGSEGLQLRGRHRLLGFDPAANPLRLGRTAKPGGRRRLPWGLPF